MYVRKSKGLKIEPWGTPIEIDFVSELEPLYFTLEPLYSSGMAALIDDWGEKLAAKPHETTETDSPQQTGKGG